MKRSESTGNERTAASGKVSKNSFGCHCGESKESHFIIKWKTIGLPRCLRSSQ